MKISAHRITNQEIGIKDEIPILSNIPTLYHIDKHVDGFPSHFLEGLTYGSETWVEKL